MTGMAPLDGTMVVVDLSDGLAGGYCTKIFADAGAEVIKIEPPEGDQLRYRSASGKPVDKVYGGPFFEYLSASKKSVVADLGNEADVDFVLQLIGGADAVVWSSSSPMCRDLALSPPVLHERFPHLLVLAITPYGLESPWASIPTNDFTLEAMAGGSWARGTQDRAPIMCGAELRSIAVGATAALALLIARHGAFRSGRGELIDCAALDAMQLVFSHYAVSFADAAGRPWRKFRRNNIPDIHRTKDGYVSLWVTTGQQWLDFCSMIERTDWLDDPSLGSMDNRALREDELRGYIEDWCGERTTDEILEFAGLLRVPAAPVANGETLPQIDHYQKRHFFLENPRTGVTQPDVPYGLGNGAQRRRPGYAPSLGEHTEHYRANPTVPQAGLPEPVAADGELPCADLRIADFTAFMAGPIIAQMFAMFGADVIHVESPTRPDGFRAAAIRPVSEDKWWESSPYFMSLNTNKRDLAVDLRAETGREAVKRVIANCDVVVENFSPRVMPQLGLDYDELVKSRPDLIMLRAPGFGTSGPWQDRVAYAPTVDAAGGASWVTGYPDLNPNVNNAASDAQAGLHAGIALLLALEYRRRTGKGMLIESPQIGSVIAASGEQIVEFAANNALLERIGNRSWVSAPQGVYRVADTPDRPADLPVDEWVAIGIDTDDRWISLAHLLGPELVEDDSLRTAEGRLAAQDRLDALIQQWTRPQPAQQVLDVLHEHGIPAARVVMPHLIGDVEPVVSRNFYEWISHDVLGSIRVAGFPARMASVTGPWHRTLAPSLGQHNREILEVLGGYTAEQVDVLEAEGVIGDRTAINTGW